MWNLRLSFLCIIFICCIDNSFADAIRKRNPRVLSAEDLAKREAQLSSLVKVGKGDLQELALVRERRGNLDKAIATWGLIKKVWGKQELPNQSSAPRYSYSKLADFEIQRLRRKRNLAAKPPKPDPHLQQRTQKWLHENDSFALEKEGAFDLLIQVDLDGDYIDEVFFRGRYGPLSKRDEAFMGIAKWNGRKYQVAYRAKGKNMPRGAASYLVMDQTGDGWKDVFLIFEPETDNVATLSFNGKEAMML